MFVSLEISKDVFVVFDVEFFDKFVFDVNKVIVIFVFGGFGVGMYCIFVER